jgi:hypothetical protein
MRRYTDYVYARPARRYGFWRFLLDCILVVATGGLWIIWIIVREIRES